MPESPATARGVGFFQRERSGARKKPNTSRGRGRFRHRARLPRTSPRRGVANSVLPANRGCPGPPQTPELPHVLGLLDSRSTVSRGRVPIVLRARRDPRSSRDRGAARASIRSPFRPPRDLLSLTFNLVFFPLLSSAAMARPATSTSSASATARRTSTSTPPSTPPMSSRPTATSTRVT